MLTSFLSPSLIRRSSTPLQCMVRSIHITYHPMVVTKISDEEALTKFTQLNTKSVLYFTATWCPPCKMISPIYDKLSHTHPEVGFGKIDVDDNSDAANEFSIQAVPTFVFLKGEKTIHRFSGADQRELEKYITQLKSQE